jgi:hypothetical protein
MGSRKIICGVCRGGVQEQWDGPGRVPGSFFENHCDAMTSEAELSLGWADEAVCPYAQVN